MVRPFTPPTLQNAVCFAHEDPEKVSRDFLYFFRGKSPPFNYKFINGIALAAMRAKLSEQQIRSAIIARKGESKFLPTFLELAPYIHECFSRRTPKYVIELPRQYYPLAGLRIPFHPPFAYREGNELAIPWPLYSKTRLLSSRQLSLLAHIITEQIHQEPDYRDAWVVIHDFSADPGSKHRSLKRMDVRDIPPLPTEEHRADLPAFIGPLIPGIRPRVGGCCSG